MTCQAHHKAGASLQLLAFPSHRPSQITLHVRGDCAMDAERLKMCTPADYTWCADRLEHGHQRLLLWTLENIGSNCFPSLPLLALPLLFPCVDMC